MTQKDLQPEDIDSTLVAAEELPKNRRAFSRLPRELSEDDLKSPGVQKMLLDYVAQVDEENARLRPFQEKFYAADKQSSILEEQLKAREVQLREGWASDALSTGTVAIGGILVGFSQLFFSIMRPVAYACVAFGVALILVGVLAKVRK